MDKNSLISIWQRLYENLPPRQKTMLKLLGPFFLGLLVIFFLKSCIHLIGTINKPINNPLLIREHHSIKIPEGSPLRSKIKIQSIKTSKDPHVAVFPGIVEADKDNFISILPPLAGHLIRLNVALGDEVKKGQVLAVIKSASFAQAYSDKLKAQSVLKQAEEALKRAQKVNHAGANSIKDLEQLESNYAQAQAEMQRAQTTLKALGGKNISQLKIRAPIDGRIIELNYAIRAYINDPTQPIFTLANINSLWVSACIPEHNIAAISSGQKADIFISAYPKEVWKGTVAFVNPIIDSDTHCTKTKILVGNPDQKLKMNMFASVHIHIPQEEQILIPLSAILMNNDSTSVYIETAPWAFKQAKVVLGTEDGNQVRIVSGLKAGDRVLTAGGILIND